MSDNATRLAESSEGGGSYHSCRYTSVLEPHLMVFRAKSAGGFTRLGLEKDVVARRVKRSSAYRLQSWSCSYRRRHLRRNA